MFYFAFVPQQRLLQAYFLRRIQVVADAAESCVWALLYGEDQIPADHVRNLLAFALPNNRVPSGAALHYLDLDHRVVVDESAALAVRALRLHRLAFAAALLAVGLHLHLHTKAHLHVLHDDSLAFALGALLQLASLGASAAAVRAVDVAVDVKLPGRAGVQLLKAYGYVGASIWPLLHIPLTSVVGEIRMSLTSQIAPDRLRPMRQKPSGADHSTKPRRLG